MSKEHKGCDELGVVFYLPELNRAVMFCHDCNKTFLTRADEIVENG